MKRLLLIIVLVLSTTTMSCQTFFMCDKFLLRSPQKTKTSWRPTNVSWIFYGDSWVKNFTTYKVVGNKLTTKANTYYCSNGYSVSLAATETDCFLWLTRPDNYIEVYHIKSIEKL